LDVAEVMCSESWEGWLYLLDLLYALKVVFCIQLGVREVHER
jgi:hypothetical protein